MIILVVFLSLPAFSQEEEKESEGKTYPVNLSLYYPLSINKTKHDRVNLNLSLIYGHVGYVSGLDLSLFASAVEHRLEGLQLCGLVGVVGGSGEGGQLSGLINIAGSGFSGFQASGLMNIAGEGLEGVQAAGLMNIIGGQGAGFQSAGLANIAGESYIGIQIGGGFSIIGNHGSGFQASGLFSIGGETFKGGQVSGLFNVVGNRLDGGQISGLFNATGDVLHGFQIAPFNVAAHSAGLQIGVANAADTSKGLQVGLVNYTKEENTGVAFGLVNLARNGTIKGTTWGGYPVAATAGLKFTINRLYSIVSLGFGNLDDSITESLTYGFHYGITIPFGDISLNPDLGYRYRDNKPLFKRPDREPDQHIWEARLTLGIPMTDRLSLVLGTGIGYAIDCRRCGDGDTMPLLIAGIEFF